MAGLHGNEINDMPGRWTIERNLRRAALLGVSVAALTVVGTADARMQPKPGGIVERAHMMPGGIVEWRPSAR